MAQDQQNQPKRLASDVTLYSLALGPVARQFKQVCQERNVIPARVLLDIYTKVADEGGIHELKQEISQLGVFMKLIVVRPLKDRLYKLFQTVVNRDVKEAVFSELFLKTTAIENESPNYRHLVLDLLPARLAANFEKKALQEINNENLRESLMRIGMELGEFLCEAGWYEEASKVLTQSLYVCLAENDLEGFKRSIKCLEKLLAAQICYSMYSAAQMTFQTATVIIKKLKEANIKVNLAGLYSVFSGLCYLECNYNDALMWSVKALEELKEIMECDRIDPKLIINILRQSAKACVVKREFHKAELLIKEAVYLARDVYGSKSVKYADALLDYGYYLLNRDSVQQAVVVYRECLQIRKAAYGRYNLMTAIILEDLSYALYVKEYSTGNFDEARSLTQKAISVTDVLLQSNHLQLASVRRVKALILEEIAIDSHGAPMEIELLEESEQLHLQALDLSKQVFGEMNVQIAKHYGNLGRLYQSMRKYSDAEAMHLKAISIKETLLGLYDYEVALSVGHLASLYNYDMVQYRKAEELHLRSISIGKRLFGDTYSGLEYDYRGLMQIYTMEGNQEKLTEYSIIFTQWRVLRDLKAASGNDQAISDNQTSLPVSEVIGDFFNMNWVNSDASRNGSVATTTANATTATNTTLSAEKAN